MTPDPFAGLEEIESDGILLIIEQCTATDDGLVIEIDVEEITIACESRQEYSKHLFRGYQKLKPRNLKASIFIPNPITEIVAANGALGIVSQVFRQTGRQLSLDVQQIMVQHMETVYRIPDGKPERQGGVKVVAKKGGEAEQKTEVF